MSIFSNLTIKNLRLNKKRAIGTIVGITLSVALICAVSGMFVSFRETLIKNSISGSGYYHIALNNVTKEKLNSLKLNKDIKDIYYTYELGVSKLLNKDDIYSELTVYSLDKETFSNLSYKVVKGTFPINSNEILISENLARETGLSVNDSIELEITSKDNKKELKKYSISGITYRQKNRTGNLAITTDSNTDCIWAYISLKKPKEYKKCFTYLLGVNNYEDIEYNNTNLDFKYVINRELLRWEVFAFSDSTISMLYTVVSVVICIILIVSIFCIRNSFAISTTEKKKLYGMLSSVGATKKQIKKSVIFEGLILGLIGIPLGIFCGFLAVFILIKVVNLLLGEYLFNNIDGLVFKISFLPVIVATLLGIVTIYFSSISSARKASKVSPIDNLRNSQDVRLSSNKLRVPKLINLFFKTGGILAYKNLKRSKKKYRTTVVSLTVSIFVFIAMYSFVNMGFEQAGMYYKDYKYNIRVNLPYGYDEENNEYIIYDNIKINKIRNLEKINNSYILYESINGGRVLDTEKINLYKDDANYDESYIDNVAIAIYALDDISFREYIKRLNLEYEKVRDKAILVNEYSYYSSEKSREIITDRYKYTNGDCINIEYPISSNKKISIELSQVTYERPIGLEDHYNNGGYLILNKDSYSNNINFYPSVLMVDASNPDLVYDNIEEIDDTVSISNLAEEVRIEKSMVLVISIFLYGFIIVITLIGVTNIFNTITSNVELRQKEFAMLKSIGMTKKEFNRMINLETIFYSAKSLVYGTVFGLIGSYLIYLGFSKHTERAYILPYKAIIICIIFVFVIVYLIMRYSVNKINKKNTIETIRNDNV